MAPTNLSIDYGALLSTTLFNYHPTLMDNISRTNAVLAMMQKNGFYQTLTDVGDRCQVPVMNALGIAHVYKGYDELDTTPVEGITSGFADWAQVHVSVSISGEEKVKNTGDARIIDLLDSKVMQAETGIQQLMNEMIIRGNGGNTAAQITTPFLDGLTGRSGVDPLPKLIDFTPATGSVMGIDPSVETWWQNKTVTDTSTTFAGFLKFLDNLYNQCGLGPGGNPDYHITDQRSFELYQAALRSQNRFTDYAKADIPFTGVAFRGAPISFDELTPDASGDTATQSATSGTWYMLNSKYLRMKVHSARNFNKTEFKTPIRQDSEVAFIYWWGAMVMLNRRKFGVIGSIDSTITS